MMFASFRHQAQPRVAGLSLMIPFAWLLVAPAWAQSAFVRVNQVGYKQHAPKRAYLMSTRAETGATFSLRNSHGQRVFSRPITASQDQGGWGAFRHVYALDFGSVTDEGRFTIVVQGPEPAVSPVFRIDEASELYSQPIANTLFFYQNQRDGSRFIPTELRTAPGHLNDRRAKVYFTPEVDEDGNFEGDLTPTGGVINAEGGWSDAGDYLKFVETHSYNVALTLIGIRDFPRQMGSDSDTSNFTNEAKFGLDWLQKMWDDHNRVFYYQVGIGGGNDETASDHDIWRLPQDDDAFGGTDPTFRFIRHRPVFINTAGGPGAAISPNLAGRLAADFALCFQIFKESRPD